MSGFRFLTSRKALIIFIQQDNIYILCVPISFLSCSVFAILIILRQYVISFFLLNDTTFCSSLTRDFRSSRFCFERLFSSSNSCCVLAICRYLILRFVGRPPARVVFPLSVFPSSAIGNLVILLLCWFMWKYIYMYIFSPLLFFSLSMYVCMYVCFYLKKLPVFFFFNFLLFITLFAFIVLMMCIVFYVNL